MASLRSDGGLSSLSLLARDLLDPRQEPGSRRFCHGKARLKSDDVVVAAPGLGASIVAALANQLRARVEIADARPGTTVSLVHTELEPVEAAS